MICYPYGFCSSRPHAPPFLSLFHQYVETISSKQSDLDQYTAEGYKNALSEERRRYCFLVDRQCAVAKNSSSYHSKVSKV